MIGRFFRLQKLKFSTHGTVNVRMQTQVGLDDDEAPVLFDDVLIQRRHNALQEARNRTFSTFLGIKFGTNRTLLSLA